MFFFLVAIFYTLLIQFALAGPIHRNYDVVRRGDTPSKRFIAFSNPISFHLLHAQETGATGVSPPTSEPTPPTSTSNGKEDGKVPAVGVGAGNTSLLALLSSTLTSSTETATSTIPPSSSGVAINPTNSQVQEAAPASTQSKQDGKVPAVGVGSGNTSLLAILSSAIDAATQTSVAVAASSTVEAAIPSSPSIAASSTVDATAESSTPDAASSTVATVVEPSTSSTIEGGVPPPLPSSSSSTIDPNIQTSTSAVAVEVQPTQTTIQNAESVALSSTSCPSMSTTSASQDNTSVVPIPATQESSSTIENAAASEANSQSGTPTGSPVPALGSPEQSIPPVPVPEPTVDPAARLPFSESAPAAPETPLAQSIESSVTPSGETAETLTISLPVTMVTTVSDTSESPSVPEISSALTSPGPLASTTVTPLVSPESLVTPSDPLAPTPTPLVAIQTPGASSEATPPVPTSASTGSAADITIPLGAFSIILQSAPVPTASGNTVIPVMGPFLTVTVTTTVTAG
ncbi:hypothetical protein EPUS_03252 [Endocarpon pusillum Z07020]|uniref:Uncharacterized protein n=1 Tax=Endocarpon pusillum (strain Z07020 / HMAS-L-300199) TaxID=1263415 RepID=U1GR76_ENDPU|nr:uncharacterized protein EPUS_03252 [Endocarpon pusillum Z07020]ERF74868.1 hypothetical protein EPUS_03252 [Endocarpon pusillum Z07020]